MVAAYVTAPPSSLYQAAMHDGETNAAAEQCDEYAPVNKAKFWPEQGQLLAAKADTHTALAMALLI